MSRLHFARVLFVLLLIVASTTMLQAQTPCPCPAPPCNPPCQTPAASPSTHGAWEAYLFAGGTTHSGNVFKDTFTVGNTTFENKDRMPGSGTFGGKVGGFVTENFSLDGNLSWYNHMFGLSDRNRRLRIPANYQYNCRNCHSHRQRCQDRALLWEASGNYDFVGHVLARDGHRT